MALTKRIDNNPAGPIVYVYDATPTAGDALKDGAEVADIIVVTNIGFFVIDTDHSLRAISAGAALASISGAEVATTANNNAEGGVPVIHVVAITAGANGDTDVVLTHKTRVIDAHVVLTGAGVASAVFTVKNGANAITDGIAASGADTTLTRAAQINDANHEIAAAGTLRVTGSGGATQPAALVYVLGIRVA